VARSGWFGYCRNIVSVLALLVTANSAFTQALPTETTGSLAFYGYTTKKVRPADLFIVDFTSTPTITGVVYSTTTTINVDPGDPWTFDSYTTGVDLRGISGTWETTDTVALYGLTTSTYSTNGDLPLTTGTLMDVSRPTLYVSNLSQQVDSYFEPGNVFGGNWNMSNDYPLQVRDTRTSVGSLPLEIDSIPTSNIAGAADHFGAWWYRPLDTEYSQYGESADVYNNIESRTGSISAPMGAVTAGSPSGNLSYGISGSINGLYGLFQEDLHSEGSGYLRESGVIGFGRQSFNAQGVLIISSQGTGIAPYPGSSRALIRTDSQGMLIDMIASGSTYRGSIGNALRTNVDFMTSGSLITSNTLSLEGSSYEGQATIAITDSNVIVSTSLISSGDVVLLTYPGDDGGGGPLWAESITPATEFIIQATNTVSTDTLVNWKIIK
jgi:hypothetical protein